MKKIMIMCNWKMNLIADEVDELLSGLKSYPVKAGILAGAAPSYTWLLKGQEQFAETNWQLAAQNVYVKEKGAYTGEVSAPMLKSLGCNYTQVGHSERRQIFQETEEAIREKIAILLAHEIKPILCLGETEEERNSGRAEEVVARQLREGLAALPKGTKLFPIAYEPVWAIGTGKHCDPQTAADMMVFIRQELAQAQQQFDLSELLLLYGGSVNGKNFQGYLETDQIDGALVGGASLKAEDFIAIIKVAEDFLHE